MREQGEESNVERREERRTEHNTDGWEQWGESGEKRREENKKEQNMLYFYERELTHTWAFWSFQLRMSKII